MKIPFLLLGLADIMFTGRAPAQTFTNFHNFQAPSTNQNELWTNHFGATPGSTPKLKETNP